MKQKSSPSLEAHFADNPLKAWRIKQSITQETLAMKLGISFATIQRWEHGSVSPKQANLTKLISLTGITDLEKKWDEWIENGREVVL